MTKNLIKILSDQKICPIIRNDNPQSVIDLARALYDGGMRALEINVENAGVYKAIEQVQEFMTVCAGGIITSVQAEAAIASGAQILSSPIFSMNLVKLTKDKKIPFIAGTSTANEAYNAWKSRIPLIKIYPIHEMGGVKYIENILRPMRFLNLMASGNVKINEVKSYIDSGAAVVGIGRDLYEDRNFSQITERAKEALNNLWGKYGKKYWYNGDRWMSYWAFD